MSLLRQKTQLTSNHNEMFTEVCMLHCRDCLIPTVLLDLRFHNTQCIGKGVCGNRHTSCCQWECPLGTVPKPMWKYLISVKMCVPIAPLYTYTLETLLQMDEVTDENLQSNVVKFMLYSYVGSLEDMHRILHQFHSLSLFSEKV